ncbi:VOC family protein [Candidatus Uhrbacteria bacterium]|nr:VOC family protein [Candidatus Uhrbacteria bacterium]
MLISELRVMVDVKDLSAVRKFYQNILGFQERVLPDAEEEIAMFELGEGRVIEFFAEQEIQRSQKLELSLEVPDVRVLWERLQEQVTVVFPLRHNEWGDTSFAIKDPAGCTLIFFTRD